MRAEVNIIQEHADIKLMSVACVGKWAILGGCVLGKIRIWTNSKVGAEAARSSMKEYQGAAGVDGSAAGGGAG